MKIDFSDQVALITGASRGIGFAIAKGLVEVGAKLIVTSTSTDNASRLVSEFGEETRHIAVDLSNEDSFKDLLSILRDLPKIDVCVNNAGIARHCPFEATLIEDWDATLDVNLRAPFFITQAVSAVMKKNSYGRIVHISSILGHVGMPTKGAYGASKFGLLGMTLSNCIELAPYNVLVNIVSPGITTTEMTMKCYHEDQLKEIRRKIPIGKFAEPKDIAAPVIFLASSANTHITGQCLVVDGGYTAA